MRNLLPSYRFTPRDTEYDIKAGYGRHNAHPRWGEIVTNDSGDYIGRHREPDPADVGGDVA